MNVIKTLIKFQKLLDKTIIHLKFSQKEALAFKQSVFNSIINEYVKDIEKFKQTNQYESKRYGECITTQNIINSIKRNTGKIISIFDKYEKSDKISRLRFEFEELLRSI